MRSTVSRSGRSVRRAADLSVAEGSGFYFPLTQHLRYARDLPLVLRI